VIICVEVIPVATNLHIDDKLIAMATKLGRHRSKRSAVTQALVEYIQHLEQQKISGLFGRIQYDPSYDYKRQRARS
jgi:Arc/MetJ family transcription regulator